VSSRAALRAKVHQSATARLHMCKGALAAAVQANRENLFSFKSADRKQRRNILLTMPLFAGFTH